MTITISVTSRWQVHIPKEVRKVLKMKKPGRVLVQVGEGKLILKPVQSKVLSMAGKYHKYSKGKKVNIDKIRDYIDYSRA